MTQMHCDVAIIGAGTAGLAAERAARKAGAKTLLIDDGFHGTTCTTVGCMPSKLLIAAANAAHEVRRASVFGIRTASPTIDGTAIMRRLRKERDRFVVATLKTIEKVPSGNRVRGKARFANPTTLAIDDGSTVSAKAIVVATGARPSIPKMFETLGDRLLTNETAFELLSLPRSLAVVGAGPLGLELAQAYARLGVHAELFDQSDRLAGLRDAKVANELSNILGSEFPFHLGVDLKVAEDGQAVHLSWSGASSGARSFDHVLVAAGRPPDFGGLNLAAAEVSLNKRGVPYYDAATLQCGGAPIFLAGDANGERPVLHEAASEGTIAGRNAAAFPNVRSAKRAVPLSIMFTDPPLSTIGAPSTDTTVTGTGSYADQGRAKVEARNTGLVKIYADGESGALTGATLLGPGMDHIAHLSAWAIERGETAARILELPFYHPTFEEGLRSPLRQICERVGAEIDYLDDVASGRVTAAIRVSSALSRWPFKMISLLSAASLGRRTIAIEREIHQKRRALADNNLQGKMRLDQERRAAMVIDLDEQAVSVAVRASITCSSPVLHNRGNHVGLCGFADGITDANRLSRLFSPAPGRFPIRTDL